MTDDGNRAGTFNIEVDDENSLNKPGMVQMTDPSDNKRYWMTIPGGPVSCSGAYFGIGWRAGEITEGFGFSKADESKMVHITGGYDENYDLGSHTNWDTRWQSYQSKFSYIEMAFYHYTTENNVVTASGTIGLV